MNATGILGDMLMLSHAASICPWCCPENDCTICRNSFKLYAMYVILCWIFRMRHFLDLNRVFLSFSRIVHISLPWHYLQICFRMRPVALYDFCVYFWNPKVKLEFGQKFIPGGPFWWCDVGFFKFQFWFSPPISRHSIQTTRTTTNLVLNFPVATVACVVFSICMCLSSLLSPPRISGISSLGCWNDQK